jgi:hypothetical protein
MCAPGHEPTVATGSFLAARLVDVAPEAITNRSPEGDTAERGTHLSQVWAILVRRGWPGRIELTREHGTEVAPKELVP